MTEIDKRLPPKAGFSQDFIGKQLLSDAPQTKGLQGCISKKLLQVLACPKCKGNLKYKKAESRLLCKKCRLAYRIEEGIPIMLVEEAEKMN